MTVFHNTQDSAHLCDSEKFRELCDKWDDITVEILFNGLHFNLSKYCAMIESYADGDDGHITAWYREPERFGFESNLQEVPGCRMITVRGDVKVVIWQNYPVKLLYSTALGGWQE